MPRSRPTPTRSSPSLRKARGQVHHQLAESTLVPQNTTDPAGEDLERLQKILDMLNDLDDVSEVYHNANLPEEEEED